MKKMKILHRVFLWALIVTMVASVFTAVPITAKAAEVTKVEKSYDIAVVFDNSGSMYNNNKAWSRAKYAMEIFASMLNYEKDKLTIFPMWEVTTDGRSTPSYEAIKIENKDDINKISNLYTDNPSNTPFEPIEDAHTYLEKSSADEKWLIILTDGAFNMVNRDDTGIVAVDLQAKVSALASRDIKVQYLGFGEAVELKANESNNFFTKKSSDTSLKDDLIEICNKMFQRSVLPNNRLSGKSLKIDLSMKNIIVFAQGANAKINSLKDSSGKEVAITLNSGQRRYSDIRAKGFEGAPIDTSLAGHVVTFDSCPKGEYTLDVTGAEAIQIFYEPDVDIDIAIINNDGQPVTDAENFVAGEYTITSKIIDSATGEDVTNHELMGNQVDIKTYVKTSADGEPKEYPNGSKVTFAADDEISIWVEGEYLGKYKISSKDDKKWEWLTKGFKVQAPPADFKIKADAGQTWFTLSEKDTWKPIKVSMTLEGQPLTAEQMQKTKLSISMSKDLKYRIEMLPNESAYNVYIAQDETGQYVEPETGRFKMKVSATFIDETGKEVKSKDDSVSFEIQKYSQIVRIIIWSAIILLLILLWLAFMLQKVLPKQIVKDTASFYTISSGDLDGSFVEVEYRRKNKTLSISGSTAVDFNEQCSVMFNLKAIDNRFTRSNRRRISVIGISSPCDEMEIGSATYVKYEGQWIPENLLWQAEEGRPIPPTNKELSCSPSFELTRKGGTARLTCKTKTIK